MVKGIADVFIQELFTVLLSICLLTLNSGRNERDNFVLPFVVELPSDSLSPLFYIKLSYVAIKDEFCFKNVPLCLFTLLLQLFIKYLSSRQYLMFEIVAWNNFGNIRLQQRSDVFLLESLIQTISKSISTCCCLLNATLAPLYFLHTGI